MQLFCKAWIWRKNIFKSLFYFQASNPTLKSKISDIYIFEIYLYIYIGSVGKGYWNF